MNRTHVVTVRGPSGTEIKFGDSAIPMIAGPCSVESKELLLETALGVKAAGACFLRGGIYKLRTNPTAFQGLGESAFSFIAEVKNQVGMPLVSEITDARQISDMSSVVDMFQVGSRNMYNYALLKDLGKTDKPVLLKRGFSATIDEWLMAADYILQGGNPNVILCERGIRSFETKTRNTLDLNAVAYIKAHSPLPIVVDPSHGTGRPELIGPMSRAAIAAGADGIMIEVHPRPAQALSDAFQAIDFAHFSSIVKECQAVAQILGRSLTRVAGAL